MTRLRFRSVNNIIGRKVWLILPLVFISLIMTGFAHRAMPLNAVDRPPAEAGYVLPDGTVLEVCLHNGNNDHADHVAACEFCRIASASHSLDGLPTLETIQLKPVRTRQQKTEAVPVQAGSYGNPARAPPQV